MKQLLQSFYAVHEPIHTEVDGQKGYTDGEYLYFTMPMKNKETIHMEQAAIAHFLLENGYHYVACPIQNIHEEWFTEYEGKPYIIYRVKALQSELPQSHGGQLASFHLENSVYRFQPQLLSSYGLWTALWGKKIDTLEKIVLDRIKHDCTAFNVKLRDILPYIIGLCENAIQYAQESEKEKRHNESDQGTITFYRYNNNINHSIIWAHDLIYDHPARDLAEQIRKDFLQEHFHLDNVYTFIQDYEAVRRLSIFSIRLLYARLIFPIHLFDCIEKVIENPGNDLFEKEFYSILNEQQKYEQKLGQFYNTLEIDTQRLQIPMLQWL
ncbi:hypothetical protein ACLIBH_04115 [Virgibacillus sp. W0430]|uniref:hypothetical protein n=1 Tax=Virgibacillus sp. W0430 TaxID=3391580 RepID=UPI003F45648E